MTRRYVLGALILGLSLLGMGCHTGEQHDKAVKKWDGTRAAVQYSLAAERYKLGNLDDARTAINQAIQLAPDNATYQVLSARIYIERNQLELADQNVTAARKLDAKNAEADYLAGVIYQRWQKPDRALEYYTAACEKAPAELSYLMAKAEMLVQLNHLDEAVTLIESKLTYFEYSGPLRDELGGMYMQQNKIPQAIETLHQATILSPDDTSIREHLARAQFWGAQYRPCLEQLGYLLKTKEYEKRADIYLLKGECLFQLKQWREARDAVEISLTQSSASAPALLTMAKIALKLNDVDRANDCVRKALAITPDDPQAYLAQAFVRLRQQKWDEALASSRKAHELDAKDPTALCLMGMAYEKSNRKDEALECYGQALQVKANDPLAMRLLSKAK